jgi:hypothetical protein
LTEVDGYCACLQRSDGRIVDLHWQGQFPKSIYLKPETTPRLVKSKSRPIFAVTAQPMSQLEVDESGTAAGF